MKHLTLKDRYYIEFQLKKKVSVAQIAKDLGFSTVTIYAEIKKGKCMQRDSEYRDYEVYLADYAQMKHEEQEHHKGRKPKLQSNDAYLSQISEMILDNKYSPEAAVYVVPDKKVCVKTIYNYIHKGHIEGVTINDLPYCREKKEKKTATAKRPYGKGRSIEERPKEINERRTKGHWEMDTVYSSHDDKTCLLVLTERKYREELLFKIPNRTAKAVVDCLNRYERKIGCKAFREKFQSITCDNGVEFSAWKDIEKSIRNKTPRTITYFCHPYCSSERGSNENQNRMVRRWIPKGDDFGLYTDEEIKQIEAWINNYPRRMFNGKSSNDMIVKSVQ